MEPGYRRPPSSMGEDKVAGEMGHEMGPASSRPSTPPGSDATLAAGQQLPAYYF